MSFVHAIRNQKTSFLKKDWSTYAVINPQSLTKLYWEIFMMFFVMFLVILIPIDAAFINDHSHFSKNLSILIVCLFSIDILVTLNSGIYIKGEQISDRREILKKYLIFWFWVDLISTVPFDLILYSVNGYNLPESILLTNNFNILSALKVLKMLRVTRARAILHKIEDHMTNKTVLLVMKLFKIILYIFFFTNLAGCLMYSLSSSDFSPDSFVGYIENKGVVTGFSFYLTSLYWAFVTMFAIGYGDYRPVSTQERVLGIIIMNFSSIIFGFLAGNFGTYISKHTAENQERREIIVNVNKMLSYYKLSSDIKKKSINHINYIFSRYDNRIDLQELLKNLSLGLREDVFNFINGNIIQSFFLFQGVNKKCISSISRLLTPQLNSPNDIIFKENEKALDMFFITKGCVHVIDRKTNSIIKVLANKDCFGEIGMFSKNPRTASVLSVSFLETLCLFLSDLKIVFSKYPFLLEKYKKIKNSRNSNYLDLLNIHCYLCKQLGHIAKKCDKMAEKEMNRFRWLSQRKEVKVLRPSCIDGILRKRSDKKVKIERILSANVWGKKRKPAELYAKKRILRAVKKFKKSSDQDRNDSRISMFSRESQVVSYTKSFKIYENVLDSEEEEKNSIEDCRSKEFDKRLIESTNLEL